VTTNELIALSFPLVTATAVGLTALFIRRPWAEQRGTYAQRLASDIAAADEMQISPNTPKATLAARQELEQRYSEAIDAAERLIRSSERIRLSAEPRRVETPAHK
jgi:hypothetical protein